ncbi:uncharacterized protein LOC131613975 [Vicia villosa]|uniref:uncharacterized protein LOC131613975 n=1 Tax=Vicia villosa TaxID=3911 RepID=UPI00273B98F8|nr:uncharacterized protein LOC131613975 [Vicia villosa]
MLVFMQKYIDRIVNVVGDSNCRFWVVSALLGKGEDDHKLVRPELIEELMNHKDSYTRVFGDKAIFELIHRALVPWLGAYAPTSKWTRFPEMGHLIACAYDMGCPIPPTSPEWALHHTEAADTWRDRFVDMMHDFERLNNIEKESNAEKSRLEPPINLAGDSSFDVFI